MIIFKTKYSYIRTILPLYAAFLMLSMLLVSCSQNSNSFVAKTYHNLLARDNAFFLARERMKLVEKQVYEGRQDNFNEVLNVIPPFDTTKTKTVPELDDIIKKASLPIRRHKNSVYVDDSYLLVGRCRMYKGEFKLGIDTYKFVNHDSENPEEKSEALIYLMRAYMAQREYDNAFTVGEYVAKHMPTSKKNLANFYLTRAQYYRHTEEYDLAAKDLEEAIPYIKIRDIKSRAHFILGQIYQEQGIDSSSYKNYRRVLKLNPPYDFEFYTKLYMTQVGHFNKKNTDNKDIEKYFAKLLKDEKNIDYKDKIYYEMAKYQMKQKNYRKAEEYYKLSLKNKTKNAAQTSFTYLALGELYFDKFQEYQLSKIYYDSATAYWDQTDKRYKSIKKRHKILTEFATQMEIIERNDSLLHLAKMDSNALNKFIDVQIAKDIAEAEKKAKEEKEKKKKEGEFNFTGMAGNGNTNSTFYFDNPTTVSNGYSEFLQKWGTRKFEDHWRRSTKETEVEFIDDTSALAQNTSKERGLDSAATSVGPAKIDRAKYLKNIPFKPEEQAKANEEVKDAYYHLGKIYQFKLVINDSAVASYKTQIKRYPKNDHEPEELYLMYLIGKNDNKPKLKQASADTLKHKYPHTSYAKLIDNPNYLVENKENSVKAKGMYKIAYQYYKQKDTARVDSMIQLYKSSFIDGTSIDDNFALLSSINMLNKKSGREHIVDSLHTFVDTYPNSKLKPYAESLIEKIEGINKPADPKTTIPEVPPVVETSTTIEPKVEEELIDPNNTGVTETPKK